MPKGLYMYAVHKNGQFCDYISHPQILTIDLLFKNIRIHKHVTNSKIPQRPSTSTS